MNRRAGLLGLILILFLAAGLRFYRLGEQSFWNDEGNSARLSERPILLIVEGAAGDVHPPLYYLALRGWREMFGESEYALRSLSAYLGVALVALTYALARRLWKRDLPTAALLAAALAAINPALVYYSQEARMYELLALQAVFSSLLLHAWLNSSGRGGTKGREALLLALAYAAITALGLYTHYFYPAVLGAHGLVVLLASFRTTGPSSWRKTLAWGASVLLALLAYSPWLSIFLRQIGDRQGAATLPIDFLQNVSRWFALGPTIGPAAGRWSLLASVALVLLGLAAAAFGRPEQRRRAGYLLIAIIVPLGLLQVAGTTQPQFFKFALLAIPPLCLLAGRGWSWAWHDAAGQSPARQLWRLAAVVLAGATLWGSARSLQNMYFDPVYARADYRGIAGRIAGQGPSDAAVVLNAANQWEVFTYYHRQGATTYPIPRGDPQQQAIAAELSAIADRHPRIYALFWGEGERDPQRLVERWLAANTYKATDEWVGGVRFVTYASPGGDLGSEQAAGLLFGDLIALETFAVPEDHFAPGEIIPVSLLWSARERPVARYKVFLHLVDESGQLLAQHDGEPGGDLQPTTNWEPGREVTDLHGLLMPEGTSPGDYRLLVGLYDIGDPANRLAFEDNGETSDAFHLATITVSAES